MVYYSYSNCLVDYAKECTFAKIDRNEHSFEALNLFSKRNKDVFNLDQLGDGKTEFLDLLSRTLMYIVTKIGNEIISNSIYNHIYAIVDCVRISARQCSDGDTWIYNDFIDCLVDIIECKWNFGMSRLESKWRLQDLTARTLMNLSFQANTVLFYVLRVRHLYRLLLVLISDAISCNLASALVKYLYLSISLRSDYFNFFESHHVFEHLVEILATIVQGHVRGNSFQLPTHPLDHLVVSSVECDSHQCYYGKILPFPLGKDSRVLVIEMCKLLFVLLKTKEYTVLTSHSNTPTASPTKAAAGSSSSSSAKSMLESDMPKCRLSYFEAVRLLEYLVCDILSTPAYDDSIYPKKIFLENLDSFAMDFVTEWKNFLVVNAQKSHGRLTERHQEAILNKFSFLEETEILEMKEFVLQLAMMLLSSPSQEDGYSSGPSQSPHSSSSSTKREPQLMINHPSQQQQQQQQQEEKEEQEDDDDDNDNDQRQTYSFASSSDKYSMASELSFIDPERFALKLWDGHCLLPLCYLLGYCLIKSKALSPTQQTHKLSPILTIWKTWIDLCDEARMALRDIVFPTAVDVDGIMLEIREEKNGEEKSGGSNHEIYRDERVMHPPSASVGSLQSLLIHYMTALDTHSKRIASELLYQLCDNDDEFVVRTGFGNAIGLLHAKNPLLASANYG